MSDDEYERVKRMLILERDPQLVVDKERLTYEQERMTLQERAMTLRERDIKIRTLEAKLAFFNEVDESSDV